MSTEQRFGSAHKFTVFKLLETTQLVNSLNNWLQVATNLRLSELPKPIIQITNKFCLPASLKFANLGRSSLPEASDSSSCTAAIASQAPSALFATGVLIAAEMKHKKKQGLPKLNAEKN